MSRFIIIFVLVFIFLPTKELNSWGFYAHKLANRYAVFTMPEELIGFFKKHIDYLTDHSVDAGQPILDGMRASEHPFVEEVIIDKSISKEDARGHQN